MTKRIASAISIVAIAAGLSWSSMGAAGADVYSGPVNSVPMFGVTAIACPNVGTCIVTGDGGPGGPLSTIPINSDGTLGSFSEDAYPLRPSSMACFSATTCFVGGWNPTTQGGSLTTVTGAGVGANQPVAVDSPVYGLACPSSTYCVGVGKFGAETGYAAAISTIQNGSNTSNIAVSGTANDLLNGVACMSATACVAVGGPQPGGAATGAIVVPIANGVPQSPISVPGVDNLSQIDCHSTTTCYAIGTSGGNPLVVTVTMSGAGQIEMLSQPADPSLHDTLLGIACKTSQLCLAVGYRSPVGSLSSTQNQMVAVPIVNGQFDVTRLVGAGALGQLACPNEQDCFAIGDDTNNNAIWTPLPFFQSGTNTTLTASPTSTTYGQSTTLTATVAPMHSVLTSTPTGSVTFSVGSAVLGSAPLNGGTASLSTTALPGGTQTVTASYSGDPAFDVSHNTTTVTVAPAAASLHAFAASKRTGSFTAALTRTDNQQAIAGQRITFQTRNVTGRWDTICVATTNADGRAACTGKVPFADQLLDNSYLAIYAGSANYRAVKATGLLTR
jgi:hypothetical protein